MKRLFLCNKCGKRWEFELNYDGYECDNAYCEGGIVTELKVGSIVVFDDLWYNNQKGRVLRIHDENSSITVTTGTDRFTPSRSDIKRISTNEH